MAQDIQTNVMAPRELVLPRYADGVHNSTQAKMSGSILISGGKIVFLSPTTGLFEAVTSA